MNEKKVTIKDIAKEMGLSLSTVSDALNGKGRVNVKTRERVIQQAREMGYYPDIIASTLSMKEKIRIGVVLPENDIYFELVLQGIDAYFKQILHYKIELFYFCHKGYDPEEQLKMLVECEKAEVNGILVSAVGAASIGVFLRRLVKRGISIVTITNDLDHCGRLCFVGQNGARAGRLAAELMEQMLPENATISMLYDGLNLMINNQRIESFVDYMQKSEKAFNINPGHPFGNDGESIRNLMERVVLEEKPDAVYVNNMLSTVMVGRTLEKMKLDQKILFFGYDANDEIEAMLRKGVLNLTLFQDPFTQGYKSLMLLFRKLYLHQEVKQEIYYVRTVVLTKSNVAERDQSSILGPY